MKLTNEEIEELQYLVGAELYFYEKNTGEEGKKERELLNNLRYKLSKEIIKKAREEIEK